VLLLVALVVLVGWYLRRHTVDVLQPAGQIGQKERNLMEFTLLISLIVVVPVFCMLAFIVVRYRESNKHATYSPELEGNRAAEAVWWAIPAIIIGVISVVTWRSSYALDPFRPLDSTKQAVHIQAVSMDWKWLFIYPDRHMASVNEAFIPANTPVDFEITSDSVMTSFWVPQLGGQMYAMPGMSTNLNLEASRSGIFNGSTANIAGKGFSDMTFKVIAVPSGQYSNWMQDYRAAPDTYALTAAAYNDLARPGVLKTPRVYNAVDPGLYDKIQVKYMTPTGGDNAAAGTGLNT